MFCSTLTQGVINLQPRVVDLHKNGMAARAATLTLTSTRRLLMFRSVYTRRINCVHAKSAMTPLLPPVYDVSVCETRHTPLNPEPEQQREPEPDIFVNVRGKEYDYFTTHSFEEDGTTSLSHHIEPPSPIRGNWWCRMISCNGLLYFRGVEINDDHLLWNPTTNEFKILPPSNVPLPPHNRPYLSDYKMWYDHTSQDYKLVILVLVDLEDKNGFYSRGREYHFDLYSLTSNSWKRIPISNISAVGATAGACINGCFHTLVVPKANNTRTLLSFDLATETLSTSPIPPSTRKEFIWILDYKGLVSFFVTSPCHRPNPEFQFWVLNNGSWTMESTFHTRGILQPLFFSRNGRLLYFSTYYRDQHQLVVFDRATGDVKLPGIALDSTTLPFQFCGSSVKLNGDSDVEVLEQEQAWEKYLKRLAELRKKPIS